MSIVLLLLGLLVLSYIGGFLVGGRAIRGFGLPSGSEYVTLGFLVGPHVLGLVDRALLDAFAPIAHIALGWLALAMGLDYGFRRSRRVQPTRLLIGLAIALTTTAVIAGIVWLVAGETFSGKDRLLIALGMGAACSETTRHALRWVVQRYKARGPLADIVRDLCDGDDFVAVMVVGLAFAIGTGASLDEPIPPWAWLAITIGIGTVLGVVAAVLLGKEFRLAESWGVLLGTAVFAIGMGARLELSTLLVAFAMGMTIARLSRHRAEVRAMVRLTERPVLLPTLVLAGARVDLEPAPYAWTTFALIVIAARVAMKLATGMFVRTAWPSVRKAGPLLGLGMLSAGTLSISVGLAFALRFPGPLGDTVLMTAAVITLLGEFVGPGSLRRALRSAGEIDDAVLTPLPGTAKEAS